MLFIYLIIAYIKKIILASQKKHIHTFLLLNFKAAHIYANNKVKLRE